MLCRETVGFSRGLESCCSRFGLLLLDVEARRPDGAGEEVAAAGGGRGLTFFAATDGRGLVGRDAAFSLRVTLGGGGGSGSAAPVGASTSTAAAASLREESRCSAFDSFARKSSAPATAFNGAGDCFFSGSAAFIASSCPGEGRERVRPEAA